MRRRGLALVAASLCLAAAAAPGASLSPAPGATRSGTDSSTATAGPVVTPPAAGRPKGVLGQRPVVSGPLSLDQAVATALRESPVVRGAVEEVEAALGRLQAARAQTRPQLSTTSFGTGGSESNVYTTTDPVRPANIFVVPRGGFFDQDAMFMLPLYTGGRLRALVRQAAAARGSASADLEGVRQEVALMTRTAFRDVLARRALIDVAQAMVAANQEQLRVDQSRFQAGAIPEFYLRRDEAEVANAQQQLTNAQRDTDLAMVQLKTVMGVHPDSSLEPAGSLGYEPAATIIDRLSGHIAAPAPRVSPTPGATPSPPGPTAPGDSEAPGAAPGAAPVFLQPSGMSEAGSLSPGAGQRSTTPPSAAASAPPAATPPAIAPTPPAAPLGAAPLGATPAAPSPTPPASLVDRYRARLLSLAEAQRPELQAARLRVEQAAQGVTVARSAYRPQLGIAAMGDFMTGADTKAFGGASFGLTASLPLFDAGLRRANLRTAEADRRHREQDAERTALDVGQQVTTALLALGAAEQNVGTAQAGVRAAEEDYRVALQRYQAGRGILVEVLDALAARTRAQTNVVQALYDYNVAQDQLRRAVGQPEVPAPPVPPSGKGPRE